jgi:hypothetical protein
MMNDECGMMNAANQNRAAAKPGKGHHSSFLIPHFIGAREG